ncbi:13523_t:CDS:2 [Racocetra fulgida]|uniref:13520_t:CDS:1 n=1 Tax=Racocetra fulgida TaxID=60492 RepID=A0A9N8VEG9_9GLOM|nr:13520_t:CDS:2 [Racocetra fulgida]CAG8452460.1 13523_t:CDS:2 [Racocetra fulgida]
MPSLVVISGGTACNLMVNTLQDITTDVSYVLGLSDNGGSTSEILRVLGGPGIGDIRSRLVRLIKAEKGDYEKTAIKNLLSYRLPVEGNETDIRNEWLEVVEGTHSLWRNIPSEIKGTIRGFLVHFQTELLRRAHKKFDFRNGSIGNFFLCGARLFCGSLESAIFLFAAITGISESTKVIPIINTNNNVAIAAELDNGTIITGQCEISHPSQEPQNSPPVADNSYENIMWQDSPTETFNSMKTVSRSNLIFDKSKVVTLNRRINRIYYINEYGQEIFPSVNSKVLKSLSMKSTLIYSIGSLYTSIMPCLILRGVGKAIAESTTLKHKILILNGSNDRETDQFTALDFITAIVDGCNSSLRFDGFWPKEYPADKYITHLIYLDNSFVKVNVLEIEKLGIECISVTGTFQDGQPVFTEKSLDYVLNNIIR